jgi:hypothetical protein
VGRGGREKAQKASEGRRQQEHQLSIRIRAIPNDLETALPRV